MTVISMIKVDKKVDHKRGKYLGTTVKTNAHENAMERTIVYFYPSQTRIWEGGTKDDMRIFEYFSRA